MDAPKSKPAAASPAPDPDQLVTLTTARTEFEGSLRRAVLADTGIDARVFAASANALQWEGGYTDPIKIQVRRADLARAADVLRKNKQDSVDLDWAEVDVGEMEAGAPPVSFDRVPYWERRARRARFAKVGFVLMMATLLVGVLGAQAAAPIAIFTSAAALSAWYSR
jgi:hypothetical protein